MPRELAGESRASHDVSELTPKEHCKCMIMKTFNRINNVKHSNEHDCSHVNLPRLATPYFLMRRMYLIVMSFQLIQCFCPEGLVTTSVT